MNRKYFGCVGLAIFIAMCLCISSSAPVDAQRTLCDYARIFGVANCDLGGYVTTRNPRQHMKQCDAGHWYWSCWTHARRVHTAHNAPAPQPTTRRTTATTTRATTTRQSQSQSPSRPAQNTPANPPQQSCTAPTVTFKKLTIGQSSETIATTFITDTETTCEVEAEVTYDGSQPPNTCEITGATWTVTMSHGFTVDSSTVDSDPEGSGFSKVWKYKATLNGNAHQEENECNPNLEPPDPGSKTDYPGRDAIRMYLTIRFTGTTSDGGTVTRLLTVTQDQKDGLRQEYVDHNRNVVPSRDKFTATDAGRVYNWGHYPYMINLGLDSMRAAWASHCVNLTKTDLIVKSGYRHPHHNVYCIVGPGDPPTSAHGLHQYGCALDIGGKIVYKNGKVDGSKTSLPDANGDGNITSADRTALKDAALKAGSHRYRKIYTTGHVHADWRPYNWIPPAGSSLGSPRTIKTKPKASSNNGGDNDGGSDDDDGADGGTSTDAAPAAPAAPTTSTPTTVACGYSGCALGGRASSRTAHQSTCPRGHVFWTCKRGTGYGNDYHGDRTCVRSGCGETFTRCSNAHRGSNPC